MDSNTDKTVTWNSIIPSLLKDGPLDTDEASSNALPKGTRMGAFEIINVIGEGGFGIVYHAYDHDLERHVALKEYMPSGMVSRGKTMVVTVKSQAHRETFGIGLKSFINEARLLAQFDAPSLVKVFQFWEANSTAYMVMPYYKGVTLKQARQAIKASPSEEWLRSFLANLFDAIEIIHQVNCYHRDIAPDNILLLENNRPLLLDFGAARRVIGDRTQGPTAILKPGFAPIEQYADIPGLKQGPWTDIYALGAVVYYLISGRPPVAAVSRSFNDSLVPAEQAGKGQFSPGFLAVVDHALAVRPENRIQTIAEFRAALAIGENVPPTLPPWKPKDSTTREHKPTGDSTAAGFARKEPWLDNPDLEETKLVGERIFIDPVTPARDEHIRQQPPLPPAPPKFNVEGRKAVVAALAVLTVAVAGGTLLLKTSGPTYNNSKAEPKPSTEPNGGTPPIYTAQNSQMDPNNGSGSTQAKPPRDPAGGRQEPNPSAPGSGSSSPANPLPMPQPSPPNRVETPGVFGFPSPPSSPLPSPGTPSKEQAKLLAEDEKWQQAVTADTIAAYREYLQSYKKGRYVSTAKASLKRLENKDIADRPAGSAEIPKAPTGTPGNTPYPARDENIEWNKTVANDTLPAYELFIKKYPASQHAAEARTRIASLERTNGVQGGTTIAPTPTPPGPFPEQPNTKNGTLTGPIPSPIPTPASKQPEVPAPDPVAPEPPRPQLPDCIRAAPPCTADRSPSQGGPRMHPSDSNKPFRVNDQVYAGVFTPDPVNGAISGKGKITWDNGDQYEGTVVRGLREGKGEFVWANGQRYRGDWSNGAPNGRGAMEFVNGQKYNGEWSKGIPNGRGTMEFPDGYKYNGDMRNGEANGKGTLIFGNGDRYTGEVKNGLQNGNGTTKFVSGDTHTGEWRNGKKIGRGRYTWANGDYWEGEYADDKQTENGRLVRASPSSATSGSASTAEQDNGANEDVAQKR